MTRDQDARRWNPRLYAIAHSGAPTKASVSANLRIAFPMIRDAHAARKSDESVSDQHFAIGAVIHQVEAIP